MFNYIVLGIVQGLTEFFPVSSTAHLIIARKLLGISASGVAVYVFMHLGTSCAMLIFFFKDILRLLKDMRLLRLVIIVTLITGAIGIFGKDFFETLFGSTTFIAFALLVSGGMLILTKKFEHAKRNRINTRDALILGAAQGGAIIPGISRSGVTISTLLFRGVDRQESFRFSFIASIPAVFGAAIVESRDIGSLVAQDMKNLAAGFLVSFLCGMFSLWALRSLMRGARFHYFGYYCIFAALLITLIFKGS